MHIYSWSLILATSIYAIYGIYLLIIYLLSSTPLRCPTGPKFNTLSERCPSGSENPPSINNIWDVSKILEETIYNNSSHIGNTLNASKIQLFNEDNLLFINGSYKKIYKNMQKMSNYKQFFGVKQFPEDINYRHFLIQINETNLNNMTDNKDYLLNYIDAYSKCNSNCRDHKLSFEYNISLLNGTAPQKFIYLLRIKYNIPEELKYEIESHGDNNYFKITIRLLIANREKYLRFKWHKIYSESNDFDYSQYIFILGICLLVHYLSTCNFTQITNLDAKNWKNSRKYAKNTRYFLIIIGLLLILKDILSPILRLFPNNLMFTITGILVIGESVCFSMLVMEKIEKLNIKYFWTYYVIGVFILIFLFSMELIWVVDDVYLNLLLLLGYLPFFQLTSLKHYIPSFFIAIFHSLWLFAEYELIPGQNIFLDILNKNNFAMKTSKVTPLNIWYAIPLFQILIIILLFQYLRRIESYLSTKIYYRSAFLILIISLLIHNYYMMPKFPREFPNEIRGIFLNISLLFSILVLAIVRKELRIIWKGKPFKELFTESQKGRCLISNIDRYLKNYKYRGNQPTYISHQSAGTLDFWNKMFSPTKIFNNNNNNNNKCGIKSCISTEKGQIAIIQLFQVKLYNYLQNKHISTIELQLKNTEKILGIKYLKYKHQLIVKTNSRLAIYSLLTGQISTLMKWKDNKAVSISFYSDILFAAKEKEIFKFFPFSKHKTIALKSINSRHKIRKIYAVNQSNFLFIDINRKLEYGNFEVKSSIAIQENLGNADYVAYIDNYLYIIGVNSNILKVYKIIEADNKFELMNKIEIFSKDFIIISPYLVITSFRKDFAVFVRIIDVKTSKTYLNLPIDVNLHSFKLL